MSRFYAGLAGIVGLIAVLEIAGSAPAFLTINTCLGALAISGMGLQHEGA